jgi:hypothetical protein
MAIHVEENSDVMLTKSKMSLKLHIIPAVEMLGI